MKKTVFGDITAYLLLGREIEFSYKGKQYSITNGDGRWMLFCDTDNTLLENLCDFEEREILVKKVGAYKIGGKRIADIFDKESDSIRNLFIL